MIGEKDKKFFFFVFNHSLNVAIFEVENVYQTSSLAIRIQSFNKHIIQLEVQGATIIIVAAFRITTLCI
jgi:hypothetical protein